MKTIKSVTQLACFISLILIACTSVYAEEGVLNVVAVDLEERPIPGMTISAKAANYIVITDAMGRARLRLQQGVRPGDITELIIVRSKNQKDYIFISPWNGRVITPSFDEGSQNTIVITLALRGDKQLLGSAKAVSSIILRLNAENAPKSISEEITERRRKDALNLVAESYGLTAEEIDIAIRDLGRRAKDPYQQGLVALYEKNFPLATEMLAHSYELRRSGAQSARSEFTNAAFFLGQSLYQQGRYKEAAAKFQEVVALRKDDAESLDWLGMSLLQISNYSEAEPLFKRALEIRERTLGKEHYDIATSFDNLALVYREQGKYTEAEPLLIRALDIREKALGKEHPDTATSLNNLALLSDSQGKYAEAEPLYQRALAITEKAFGKEHPSIATSLNNLAQLYYSQRRYLEAEPLFMRALNIQEKAFRTDHPDVAATLNNLGSLYIEQGKYAEAEVRYKRALDILEKTLGKEHPLTSSSLNNLALLYQEQRKYAEAELLFKRALDIREKTFGEEHPDTIRGLNNLALLYRAQGRYAEAEPLYQRALAITEKALGREHPSTATSLINLAQLYYSQRQYVKAETLFMRALDTQTKTLGENNPNVATLLNNLADLYKAKGEYRKAEQFYVRALSAREKTLGPNHLLIANVLMSYADLLKMMNKAKESDKLITRANAIILNIRNKSNSGDLTKPNLYVLAIGISSYATTDIGRLAYAAKDARDFAGVLQQQKDLLYKDVMVTLLTDEQATRNRILDGFDWIQRQATSKDVAMIFIAGHGENDAEGEYFFYPYDVDPSRTLRTGVALTDIKRNIDRLTGKVIVFMDACRSASGSSITRRGSANILNIVNELGSTSPETIIFAASANQQASYEDPKWRNGVFTMALIEGISGRATSENSGNITIDMLAAYVSNRVRELTAGKQMPVIATPNLGPNFPIAVKK